MFSAGDAGFGGPYCRNIIITVVSFLVLAQSGFYLPVAGHVRLKVVNSVYHICFSAAAEVLSAQGRKMRASVSKHFHFSRLAEIKMCLRGKFRELIFKSIRGVNSSWRADGSRCKLRFAKNEKTKRKQQKSVQERADGSSRASRSSVAP